MPDLNILLVQNREIISNMECNLSIYSAQSISLNNCMLLFSY